jgi:hypothetical protein
MDIYYRYIIFNIQFSMAKRFKLPSVDSRIATINNAKYDLHKIWLSYPNVEIAGRLTDKPDIDIIGQEDGIPYDKIRYDLPGIRFHTHPRQKDFNDEESEKLTPPSVEDYINIITHKQTEYILTEYGIWMIQPLRTTTFITECALAYYVFILNIQLIRMKYAVFPSLRKNRQDINYLTKIYSKLMSDPDGRLLNISELDDSVRKTAIKETVACISTLYSEAPKDIIKSSILSGMAQFIGDPPVKVTWHLY